MSNEAKLAEKIESLQKQLDSIRSRIDDLPEAGFSETAGLRRPFMQRHRALVLVLGGCALAAVCIGVALFFLRRRD